MKYICDAPERKPWFRIETEVEAEHESALMNHAVAKHFRQAREAAVRSFKPASGVYIESSIGLERHIQRTMPLFLTLRDYDGSPLVTAKLPPEGQDDPEFRYVIVGPSNSDPYPFQDGAIRALGAHFGLELDHSRCYPYRR